MCAIGNKFQGNETEVWNAIAAFEEILEAIPTDRVALETLFEAYTMLGDQPKALGYLLRLGQVVLEERDSEAAEMVREHLLAEGAGDLECQELADKLSALSPGHASQPAGHPEEPLPSGSAEPAIKPGDITAEMTLAWNLMQAKKLNQDDYARVVRDLSESGARVTNVPVSVLHVLEDAEFRGVNDILAWLSQTNGLPLINLSMFEIPRAAYSLLGQDFMLRHGAIVFSEMGPDLLVALLNPYHAELKQAIERAVGRTCHFYLTRASEYDAALNAIRKDGGLPDAHKVAAGS